MSKYNQYAKRLDTAFKTAREEYMEAWNKLQAAQKANTDAQAWRAETYRGENDLRRQRARAQLLEAEHTFKAAESRVWAEFDRQKEEIRRDLESEVRATSTVDPDAIDTNALELLKSGILTADDIFSMVDKYDSNITMLRLISKTAKELADDKNTDTATCGQLYMLCSRIRNGRNSTMRNFDDLVEISNYGSGRGGGGFPAGRKWDGARKQKSAKKYIVCNGDEGDPGAFMDRSVMEGNPHSVLEGMMIAGLAVGSDEGYIYVRAEYPLAVNRLKTAIARAEEMGLLGTNILGSDFNFRIHVNKGAGAFVCGEGSALTASIEGNRGMPRVKPPRTIEHGLWAEPTVLNNVETFANVPLIIKNGVEWYHSIGTEKSPGTKAFALTGNVVNTGLIEVPMGTTIREVVFDIGGGIPDGKKFKAVQIGGPSGGATTASDEHLDLPLDFDSLKSIGAMIGSGGLVVMDEDTCMVETARFFMRFTQNESCGKCVPCREGTKRMLEILDRIIANEGSLEDLDLLQELSKTISETALCGLGQSACKPVQSTLRHFRQDYLRHVVDHHCPICNGRKRRLVIKPELCKGCGKCKRNCPMEAISGEIRMPHTIDNDKCIHCGACWGACPFGAIDAIEEED